MLTIAAGAFIAACIMLGGGVFRPSGGVIVIAVVGSILICTVALCATVPRQLPRTAIVFLAMLVLLPALQLVPLPPSWWTVLPGRELATQVATLALGAVPWRPITLSVTGTLSALLCIAWLVALLVAVLSISETQVRRLMLLILGLGIVHILIGAVQVMSNGTALNFYNNSTREYLLGFFANKNHSGLFLACLLFIGFALAPRGKGRRDAMVWMVPAALAVMAAILATYSRAGLLLGIVALVLIAAMMRAETKQGGVKLLAGLAGGAAVLIAVMSTAIGERALARFGLVDNDLRWLFWRGSWPLAKEYFPVGAGFGTFQQLFAVNERLEWVKQTYVNNAHNDYLEVVMEAGLPGLLMIALLVVVLAQSIPAAWKIRHTATGRWALAGVGIMILFAAHSLGDYPLRRLGPAALFFFALALALRVFAHREGAGSGSDDAYRGRGITVPPLSGS